MKTWIKLSLVGLGVAAVGGGAYLYSQLQKIKTGTFKVLGVKDLKVNAGKLTLTIMSQFKNNSNISATVTNQDYDVLINGTKIGNVSNHESVFVKANDYNIIPLNIEVSLSFLLQESLANLGNILNNKKEAVTIALKGNLTWKKGFVSAKQPFDISYTLKDIQSLISKK